MILFDDDDGDGGCFFLLLGVEEFLGRLQDWKDIDEKLLEVLASIANLRDRILWESKERSSLEEQQQQQRQEVNPVYGTKQAWDGYGYRFRRRSHQGPSQLIVEDIDLALSHDLLQHERMLSSMRTLISSLADVQDALGRRLDEWMIMETEQSQQYADERLDHCQQIYVLLAQELYRKQMLVQRILDSYNDEMLNDDVEGEIADVIGGNCPRSVARQTIELWPSRNEEYHFWMRHYLAD